PELAPDVSGLPLFHYGWSLGNFINGRFNPSHALALGIKSDQGLHNFNLAKSDSRLMAYFSGETIKDSGENCWILMSVDGFPIGWGKRVNNVIKNFYPHGLRRTR
ncbi:MAG TPA: RsmF rRNA methyltransferase first C-terminal domain-containing protein, partial [Anaerolineales bacterium]|nr:RsmF rRNA methyltransferase first C-terminal domain-containing protein [Anaerolineales bacterium]